MVVALFAPPLEAWIRWVAPFYVLTITFRKPDCVYLASDFGIFLCVFTIFLRASVHSCLGGGNPSDIYLWWILWISICRMRRS